MTDQPKKRGFFSRLFGRGKTEAEPQAPDAHTSEPEAAPEHVSTYQAPSYEAPSYEAPSYDVPSYGEKVEPNAQPTAPIDAASAQATEPRDTAYEAPVYTAPSYDWSPAADEPPAPHESETGASVPTPRVGWLQRLKTGLQRTASRLTDGIAGIVTRRKLDAETLEELEDLLIQADLGVDTAARITEKLKKTRYGRDISSEEVRTVLAEEVEKVLEPVATPLVRPGADKPHVILFVGVNGTGKTTTIGKLSAHFRREGHSVMMAAGDTFRAAAVEQLAVWGQRTGAPVVTRPHGADAAGLAFDALVEAKAQGTDVLLIDTAGRLQNKAALMDELEKVIRVIRKQDPTAPHQVLLVLDATTGQNALSQVDVFKERAGVTGLVMTKLDGTARGGILVAISAKFGLPIVAIGVGEGVDDLQAFDARAFARAIAQV